MADAIQQGNTSQPIRFLLVLASDHVTGATGITPTVVIAKNDGLGFVSPSGAVSELGDGWYQIAANATDADTLGPLTVHATGTGCDPSDREFTVVNYNPTAITATVTPDSSSRSVADMITAALRRINVLQAGEVPTADDLADAFLRFNDLVASLALERLSVYTVTRTTFTITSTKGILGNPYTVGSGGDINTIRPGSMNHIDHVNYQDTAVSPTLERPLTPLTRDAYAAIPQKGLTSTLPTSWFYEPTYPTGSLYLWLVPTQSNLQGVFYAATPISAFGHTSDIIALPPGYNRMLRDNLALELWPEWRENVNVDPLLVKSAEESKQRLKMANVQMVDATLDAAITIRHGLRYDINTDGTF